jgi:FkbM family methyltransferase
MEEYNMMPPVVESWDGFKWIVEEDSDREVLSKGELSVLRALYTITDAFPQSIFVDIGAYKGYYTVRLAKRCRKVIAFEPNPFNREKLIKNVELNNLTNVVVYPYACGESRYKAKLYPRSAGSTLLSGYVEAEPIDIDVIRVDDLIEEADIIKIDTEGYEYKVIKGAEKLIEKRKPIMVIEHHDFRGYKIEDYPKISSMLREMGYVELYLTTPHHLYYHRSRPLHVIKPIIAHHWIAVCIKNLEEGRPWYYGLPYEWWWGMNLIDFIQEITDRILRDDEPDWIRLLIEK